MSTVTPYPQAPARQQWDAWREGHPPVPREHGGPPWGLVVAGLAVVGLGLLAWNYLGPDLRRYLKIRSM